MYFRIMNASSGGIGIEYLEKQPFIKISWLSRLAEASLVQRHLDNIYSTNTGYYGDQGKLDRLQQRIDFLLLDEPKTDVEKLRKYKDIQKTRIKKAKEKKERKDRRKRIKLELKKDE
jgi:hypothetical protein